MCNQNKLMNLLTKLVNDEGLNTFINHINEFNSLDIKNEEKMELLKEYTSRKKRIDKIDNLLGES